MPQHPIGLSITMHNTKWLKNGKFRKAILSAFYNISQRNFGILLILWCSFISDQKFSYKGKGPFTAVHSRVPYQFTKHFQNNITYTFIQFYYSYIVWIDGSMMLHAANPLQNVAG
jgi:hypothetical protein